MTKQADELFLTLSKMVKYCRDMRALLNDDKQYFSKNDLPKLMESNKHKYNVITHLENVMQQISHHPDLNAKEGGLLALIEKNIDDLPNKKEMNDIVNALKEEMTHCYQDLLINSKIVYKNIEQLKHVWDELLSFKSQIECVYDHKGTISK